MGPCRVLPGPNRVLAGPYRFQPGPTRFNLVMRFPDTLSDEMVERLRVIAAKCPVHRTLDGEVMFEERVERVALTS